MQSENISTPIYVNESDKMYQSKVCVQEFSFFVSGLDIQLEQSGIDICMQKKAKYDESYTVFFEQFTNQWFSG